MNLFTCRDDVSEIYKLFDPAWMFHCPVDKGLSFLDCIPETIRDGEIYYFKEPYNANLIDFTSLFDGQVVYEEIGEHQTLLHCFIVNPSDSGRKVWGKVMDEYRSRGSAFKVMAAHYM